MTRPLSPRELQVLHRIANGDTQAAAGNALGISVFTVKSHLQRITKVLGASNAAHAVAIAIRSGDLPRNTATHRTARP
ncbi:response regulator transcription factor [Streptomyces sp. NPDC090026]|uniref:response regulator transcription factor n=1 Tax=Streptomyces sp. NPDC090026 TaxID=3365923 RepID=UPI00381BA342